MVENGSSIIVIGGLLFIATMIIAALAIHHLNLFGRTESRKYNWKLTGDLSKPGVIYVLRCEAHIPNLFKVGYTTKSAKTRAAQLSKATATPLPFEVVHTIRVGNVNKAEKAIHGALDDYRFNKRREFFQAPLELIVNLLKKRIQIGIIEN